MPQTQQVMRGNLAANPRFWPARAAEDGSRRSAYLEAIVYRNVPERDETGAIRHDEAGNVVYREPEKATVKFYGRTAEILHELDFRQGDPVVATGRLGQPDAFISQRDGQAYARTVINGETMQIDAIREAQRNSAAAAANESTMTDTATASADVTMDDPWNNPQGPVL